MPTSNRQLRSRSIRRRIISGSFVWSVHSTRGSPGTNCFGVSIVREYRLSLDARIFFEGVIPKPGALQPVESLP